jgi:hypothetical protein
MPAQGSPYLSIVVTARNDDHGGNLLRRMQAFAGGWISQARKYGIPSELIIVEWNPPPDRPRLAEVLQWPSDLGPCQVRLIEVPSELHARFAHADALPLYQMVAKNVGIRRARGEYVLATNIDILFSSELACFFAARRLQHGRMYRIDRHDAMSDVPVEASIEEQLDYCKTHLIRINVREGSYNVSPEGRPVLSSDDIAAAGSGLLFGKGWLPVERYTANEPFRWAGQYAELLLQSPPGNVSALVVELEPGPGTGSAPLDLEVIAEGHLVLAHVNVSRRSRLRLPLPMPLPARLWFRVHQAGLPAEQDPRVLNFRAFRLDWETDARGGAASVHAVGGRNFIVSAWFALQHLIDRLAKGGRLVRLTVPVSPRLQRRLKMYIEYRGLVGMLRHSWSHFKRRRSFQASAPPGEDIFPPGCGLSPGAGWQPLEDYRGESFRRAHDGAEVIVSASAAGSSELAVQAEPIEKTPPLELSLLDTAGKTIASQRVAGLAWVRFPIERAGGKTQIVRLALRDAAGGSPAAGLKVFWCGWTGRGHVARPAGALSQPWGAGWRWDPESDAMTTGASAELVVRTASGPTRPLFIDLESSAPVDFEIRDQAGARLATGRAADRAVHRLDLQLEPARTHVLEFTASGPVRAFGCDWNESPAAHATFIHTNACGDFTLLAREHWFDLRGYPEFDLFSMNLDSIFCIAAHHGGAPEQMLPDPMRIYHLEHATGSGWTPEGQAKLFERVRARGLSFVDNEEVLVWASQMNRFNSPMIFNHENWGMADCELKETVLAGKEGSRQAGGK